MKKSMKTFTKGMFAILVSLILIASALPIAAFFASGEGSELVVNGNFEDGTTGYTKIDVATFEVIAEPGNTTNHVLHLIGGGSYYQSVAVEKNTDYIWTFKMKDLGNTGSTRILVYPENSDNNLITSILHGGGGYASINDGTYASAATYNKAWVTFTVKFNSGDNETIRLFHNTWTTNREIYMDDWSLAEVLIPGDLVNGDMENGTKGYTNMGVATFENIAEPENLTNHVLHLIGGGIYYQSIAVEKNTDYIWSFRMKDLGNTGSTRILVNPEDGTSNLITSISQSGGGYASANDGTYASAATYNKAWVTFTVKFNSGNNEAVKLLHNTWTTNREIYMDNWAVMEVPAVGAIVNGNFDKGIKGFTNMSAATFEVIAEPENLSNKVLHLVGSGNYYQSVAVEKNTDYVWTFRMKDLGDTGTTRIYVHPDSDWSNLITEITQDGGGYASVNDGSYASAATYNKAWVTFTVKFNSGNNETVKLLHNTWSTNREMYMDDWKLAVDIKDEATEGEFTNGDFEKGTTGYTNIDTSTFEVISEPENPSNHVLHLIGGGSYYQSVAVEKNTNYIWTFRMKDLGNTGTTRILVYPENGTNNLITSIQQSGGGYASTNDGTYASAATYNKAWVTFTVNFNSGDNEVIKLQHNTWTTNREIYMDDWTFSKPRAAGELLNGSFDEGTMGYTDMGVATFEVIPEPENTENNILHLIGGGSYYQQVPVEKNTDYVWTFKMKDIGNTGTTRILVNPENGADNLITSIAHGGGGYASTNDGTYAAAATYNKAWVTFTVRFNSGNNSGVKLLHNTWTTNREIYMDDWKLKVATPPGEVANGDFEKSDLSDYEADKQITVEHTEEGAHGGNGAVCLTKEAVDGGGFFHQSITVEKNTDYIWHFWAKFNNANTPIGATVRKTGGANLPSRIGADLDSTIEPSPTFDFHRIRYNDAEWHEYKIFFSSGDCQAVDLAMLVYRSEAQIFIDDWSVEKIGTTVVTDTLIDVDFENENMGCHEITRPCWTVTDEQAHGGTKSIKYDGSTSAGPLDLFYLDKNGVISDTVGVEKNTKYRFSFWYKGEGDRLDMANVTFRLYSGGATFHCTDIYINENTEWKYAEHIFDSGDKSGYRLMLNGMILGSRKFKVYLDDIKLEKINVGVSDEVIYPSDVSCTDEQNLIPADSKGTVESGYSKVQKLTLSPYGIYNFKVDFNATGANGKIGLAIDENGTPLTERKSILSVTETYGDTESHAFTFTAPEDGIVYLVTTNDLGAIEIKDFVLYAVNPTPETPVEKVVLQNPTKNDKVSIWDQEFEFDFDWNTEYDTVEDDFDSEDEEVKTEDNESDEEEDGLDDDFFFEENEDDEIEDIEEVEQAKGKKYQRVKKRKLIQKGTPGISVTTIILICVGAAVLLGAVATFIIVFVHKKKHRN